jgi:hypothetical protein
MEWGSASARHPVLGGQASTLQSSKLSLRIGALEKCAYLYGEPRVELEQQFRPSRQSGSGLLVCAATQRKASLCKPSRFLQSLAMLQPTFGPGFRVERLLGGLCET